MTCPNSALKNKFSALLRDSLFDQVVRVPGCRSRGPGSIPGATRFSKK
jgi:hypothetical protein